MESNKILYYDGTFEEYKQWLTDLYNAAQEKGSESEEAKKYNDIFNAVVYISEHIGDTPEQLCCTNGAVYAHGAIISGGSDGPEWEDDIDPSCN